MSFYSYYRGFGNNYTTVSELKAKAANYIGQQKKKGVILSPVLIEGRVIAKSWWGKAWCENLEKYADYENRLERGRKYVRANCVLDLQINKGEVKGLVQGSKKKPYNVIIKINTLSKDRYKKILSECSSKIQNIDDLIKGKFSNDLKELFTEKNNGLFPSMSEIDFSCSCPDWAGMCKHVAAVLYGIGTRFDTEPLLFFTLRGIDTKKLIGSAIENKLENMIKNANKPSTRIMDDTNLSLFGL